MNVELGESGKLVVGYARKIAAKLKHSAVGSEHLLLGVGELEDLAIRKALVPAGLDLDEACVLLRRKVAAGAASEASELPLSAEAISLLERAYEEAVGFGERAVEAHHVLLALLGLETGPVALVLQELDVDAQAARKRLQAAVEAGQTTPSDFYKTRRNVEQAGLSRTAELLDSLGRDLTRAAEEGELSPIVGRERELGELGAILLGLRKPNAVLIGDPGVGKTAIVEGLAQRIVHGEAPGLEGMRIRTIEVGSLVAGTIYRGQFEQRLKDLIDGVRERDDVILFIDELHMLVGAGEAGRSGSVDAANMLKPVLSEGKLKVIGSTTTDEYRRSLEPDRALMRRFQPIGVGEPSREETIAILSGLRPKYEAFHLVKIADEALRSAVDLSTRYVHDRSLPDKAVDLVDRACTERKLAAGVDAAVGPEDVAEVVSVQLGIPIARLTQDERERLAGMADALERRVFGQARAVEAVTNAVVRARTGVLASSGRPDGVFLFLGPTGVGKTKLAQELAAFLFGDEDELIELDMSQYAEPFSASELVGAPTGVTGWERGGKLTNAVRAKPYSVVLLDEFEKAHPSVWDLFLPIFDNGRLDDALDRVIDFRNTVVIMTTNVGARRFQARTPIGFAAPGTASLAHVEEDVLDDLKDTFTPEFLNRIDETIVFNALTKDDIRRIVRRQIEETVRLELDLTPEALDYLVDQSYDPAMGARPVRRAIQRLVANPLSTMVARGELDGRARVQASLANGALTFHPVRC